MNDLDTIRKMVEPLADRAGIFRSRVLGMITRENVRAIYEHVGREGICAAAEAIIRIGEEPEDVQGER